VLVTSVTGELERGGGRRLTGNEGVSGGVRGRERTYLVDAVDPEVLECGVAGCLLGYKEK
jgi:hypothetical protein